MLSSWLSQERQDFAEATARWAKACVEPHAAEVDRTQEFSTSLWHELRDFGVFGLALPESVGGAGGSVLDNVIALEQIAQHSAVAALYPGTTSQVARTLIELGSPAVREEWVPRLAAGTDLAAWAFTESATGSDPKQLTTKARRDGSDWVLDGEKAFISFANQASVALVFAKSGENEVTAFLVDTDQPSWTVGAKAEVLAFGGTEASIVHLDGVRVPGTHVVGEIGGGFSTMLAGEAIGKVRVSAINVGVAERALHEATSYALQRPHRGTAIGEKFASIKSLLARMQGSVLAARAMLYETANWIDAGRPPGARAAALRLVTGSAAREVTSSALEVCGAYGLTKEMVVERLYREGKFFEVAQGSVQLQEVVVGNALIREQ